MMTKTWKRLAEALGVDEAGANWQKVNQKKNMQRWGTADRNTKADPLMLMRQRNKAMAPPQAPNMTPRPGGVGAPSGTDRPGQGNPLMRPTPARAGGLSGGNPNSPSPARQPAPADGPTDLGTPNDHGMPDDQWLDMLLGDRDDEHDDD